MKYQVETFTICDGWTNCWTSEDDLGNDCPVLFDTIKEAQADLDDLFDCVQREIDLGNRQPDEGYDRDDFRIVKL